MSVRPGISVLINERRDLLAGKRVGVLTNASGVLPDLTSSVDALIAAADVRAIFGPEHGVWGAAAPGAHIAGGAQYAGIPIHSLYSDQLAPVPEHLRDLDLIVCDLQDVGCRFYTYMWTVTKLIEVAAQAQVAVIVADRPNPVGGVAIEGPSVEASYRTLVGLHDVPIRHGLTYGELAHLINREAGYGADLTVVACDGWQRTLRWSATGLPWIAPSPNMPTAETALVYAGTCLIEGVNVSVGRGTAKPFEWLGAPWIEGRALATDLNAQGLPGVRWRPIVFEPCAGPYAGETCAGVQPHVIDPDVLQPVRAGVALLVAIKRLWPDHLAWDAAHFDRLAGSPALRHAIDGGADVNEITGGWRDNEARFGERVAPVLMYR